MSKIKVCILAIFFSINITVNLFSDEFPCFDKIENDNTNYYLDNRLDLIDITVKNNRKWNINNRRLILDIQKQNPGYTIDGFGTIKKKYKKKFKAEIKVKYKDGNICIFAADVRQHGDMMDHVRLANGNVFQSLSVSLINGNINGVTKFILFLSGTRKFDDEIFITELLRNLNYLAPRTKITKVKVNNNSEVEMLFQEKASKELLESNNLREGPIFEGDETYRKLLYEQTNNLRIAKNDLSKQTNTIWAKKNNNFKNVSTLGLTYLNQFFLSNNLLEEVNNKKINFPVVNMDNSYLSLGNNQQNEKLDKFNILMSALNAQHGLINNNRKFYWNSIYGFFEPIYYDGGVHIETLDLNSAYNVHSYPKQEDVNIYVEELKEDIEKINFDLFYTNYKKTNILTTKKIAFNKKEQVIKNLNRYKKNYTTIKKDVTLVKTKEKEIKNKIFEEYVTSLKKKNIHNHYLVFKNPSKNMFYSCGGSSYHCVVIQLNHQNEIDLLKGVLTLENKKYHYVGSFKDLNKNNYKNYIYKINKEHLNKINILDSTFYFDNNIEFNFNKEKLLLEITQNKNNARAYFLDGKLNDINITFKGSAEPDDLSLKSVPIGDRALTGCLTFVNVFFSNVSINSSNTNCEDSVNIISSTGEINYIGIQKSFLDALDIDFSNLKINEISVINAGNDCIDVSYGYYYLNRLSLNNCGDKGLSVGEKSITTINKADISNSEIGITSKDSSKVTVDNLSVNNVKTCVAAYKKKQEFFGGFLKIKNIKCKNYIDKIYLDKYSKIILQKDMK